MKFLFLVTHPILILPWGIVIAFNTGGKYEPWQIATANIPIFLQGGTDWGGSCMFAGWMANYIFFSFVAPIYAIGLVVNHEQNFITIVGLILRRMKWHILFFFILGPLNIPSDASITPNDHRNLFLFFFVYYSFLIFFVSALLRYEFKFKIIFSVIPSLLLFFMMNDGITTKAGQWNVSGVDPEIHVRGIRHQLFLDWHMICDFVLGDVESNFLITIDERIRWFY
ncbi:hypothetical protein [Leptospira alexanderi]|uniref:hypothetical protein n=1 Tax=Leptospira alexanderi TaxID=100053 RepID=UPI000990A0FF|nr:hypothetical protein [Leptospira alexanderi]